MDRRFTGIVVVMAWLAGAAPTAAFGAEVGFNGDQSLVLAAEPGETNDLVVTSQPLGDDVTRVRLVERGPTPLTAGASCVESEGNVTCDIRGLRLLYMSLDDGDDKVDASGFRKNVTAHLGEGNDTMTGPTAPECSLNGGRGDDRLTIVSGPDCGADGENGNDRLEGGPSDDGLAGGDGDDLLLGRGGDDGLLGEDGSDEVFGHAGDEFQYGGSGDDILLGGPGSDHVLGGSSDPGDVDVYEGGEGNDYFAKGLEQGGNDQHIGGDGIDRIFLTCRTCNVSLDGQANDGHPGELDNIVVEQVRIQSSSYEGEDDPYLEVYGSGRDEIIGNAQANTLAGFRGKDRIVGGRGEDVLYGGQHMDDINAFDGETDLVDCGTGPDKVVADPIDELENCETVTLPSRDPPRR